jgi:hypothetical protein
VSVDTNTKGKDLSPYHRVNAGEVEILLAPRLGEYATAVRLGTRRGLLGQKLTMDHDHRHGTACRH